MHDRKPRPKEAPIPPGAKLVWSDEKNQLVLQLPTGASPPSPPVPKPPSAMALIIDRVLSVPAPKAGKQA
jgi:hypothetical protein